MSKCFFRLDSPSERHERVGTAVKPDAIQQQRLDSPTTAGQQLHTIRAVTAGQLSGGHSH